jgi:dCTP deaminase
MFSVLADKTIQRYVAWGKIGIEPYNPARVQPASVDLTLGSDFKRYRGVNPDYLPVAVRTIDLKNLDLDGLIDTYSLEPAQSTTLWPGQFCLGTTNEHISVPDDLVARVEGKSSLGRLGLTCHATAGFIDPGFEGRITLEFYNMNSRPILLYPGIPICQLSFMTLTEPCERPYGHPENGNHYQGQKTATESRYEFR